MSTHSLLFSSNSPSHRVDRRRYAFAAALAALGLVAGCGGDTQPGVSGDTQSGDDSDANTEPDGEVTDNGGEVTDNGGEVTDNGGEVTDNGGEVTDNGGEVTPNSCMSAPCAVGICVDLGGGAFDCRQSATLDASAGGSVAVATGVGNVTVSVGARAFVHPDGVAVSGDISLVVGDHFGGGYAASASVFSPRVLLDVGFEDALGAPLALAPGRTATLALPLPSGYQAGDVDSMWYYDAAAQTWRVEASGLVVARGAGDLALSAVVSHFTPYAVGNLCSPIEGCASVDCDTGTCTECEAGYARTDAGRCVNVDDCVPGACAGGSCFDGVRGFTCGCPARTYGNGTNTCRACRPSPAPGCEVFWCDDPETTHCQSCELGYHMVGEYCVEDDALIAVDCDDQACGAGSCIEGVGAFTCDCPAGYFGDGTTSCQKCTEVAHCRTVTCMGDSDARCLACEPGFLPGEDGACHVGDLCEPLQCSLGACDRDDPVPTCACDQNGFTASHVSVDRNVETRDFAVRLESADATLSVLLRGAGLDVSEFANVALGQSPKDANLATCETCAVIRRGDKLFFATSGVLAIRNVDPLSQRIDATLENATFVEVMLASGTSIPVPHGETWCITQLAIASDGCGSDGDCGGETPWCQYGCVECRTSFDCPSEAPTCDVDTGRCAPGSECVGDDAVEGGDDGPAGATLLTLGAEHDAKICGQHADWWRDETDWYSFTLDTATHLAVTLDWADASDDLDFYLEDASRAYVNLGGATSSNHPEVVRVISLPAGVYYVYVHGDTHGTQAHDYQLTVAPYAPGCVTDADCTADPTKRACFLDTHTCIPCNTSFNCADPSAPVCDGYGVNSVCRSLNQCDGDDGAEPGDDGPAGATVLTVPTGTGSGRICPAPSIPPREADFYRVRVAAGANLNVALAWDATAIAINFKIWDEHGGFVGWGTTHTGTADGTVTVGAAGDYYIEVFADNGPLTATPYTISTTTP